MLRPIVLLLTAAAATNCKLHEIIEPTNSADDIPDSSPGNLDLLLPRRIYPIWKPQPLEIKGEAAGNKLILSNFMENDEKRAEGRQLARVEHPDLNGLVNESYAGYFTVDPKYDSNLFFWFFPARAEYDQGDNPIILWLQGGPGVSSLFALFHEIGPLELSPEGKLGVNPYTWNTNYSLLFIDNPVGTGFSFTNHSDGFCTNQKQIGSHLYKFLVQFFDFFNEYQSSPFFIAGESYAGKHVPSVAHEIIKHNPTADMYINLQGIAIGNGYTEPAAMFHYGEFLYQMGLVERDSYRLIKKLEDRARYHIKKGQNLNAFFDWILILGRFIQSSGMANVYNLLESKQSAHLEGFSNLVQNPSWRFALNVGDTEFTSVGQVYEKLMPDFMNGVWHQVEDIARETRVLFYSGQMDIIVAYPLTAKGLFEHRDHGPRFLWLEGDDVAGYIQESGNMTFALVRNAGHMVPSDQPAWALSLIDLFVTNQL